MTTEPHAELDFETYSEAGFVWDEAAQRYRPPPGAQRAGLSAVNSARYSEHPSTEVLTLSYTVPGWGAYRWRPGEPLEHMEPLFAWLAAGLPVEAHNAMFEWLIWVNVCIPRYGFPAFRQHQLRCSMATARVNNLPGGLGELSRVLNLPTPKDSEGERLIKTFSVPRAPTKTNPARRIRPEDAPADFERFRAYCDTDLLAERGAVERMTPMSPDEYAFWCIDQEINYRGIAIDRAATRDCIAVLEQAHAQYGDECRAITGLDATQLEKLKGWLAAYGVYVDSLDAEAVTEALAREGLPAPARRVLEIRQLLGSASVKKLYAMENQACRDDRLRNLIVHHATRTGRPGGEGPQPLNLPRAGPSLRWCASEACGRPFKLAHTACPWCGTDASTAKERKWSASAVEPVLEVMASRSLPLVQYYFGDALACISGCVRGLFVAGPGMELIASDFSAIEAVVIAMLAGEQWRIDAFRRGDPIYLVGASKITGRSLEYYLEYYAEHGEHHRDRQVIGKVSELACGFGGWVNSYKAFGSTEDDGTIRQQILAWRAASPAIVELWGGQFRGAPWDDDQRQEYYGLEGAAVQAIQYPGTVFDCRGLKLWVRREPSGMDALIIRLLSGRELTYHEPRLTPASRKWSRPGELVITYMTYNSNPKYGAMGWVCMSTYGGRLTENVVQATAHDILRYAITNLRAAGYPCTLHVYDEVLCEVPKGTANLAEFEHIMQIMPPWASDWPIVAAGGWVGHRYRKG